MEIFGKAPAAWLAHDGRMERSTLQVLQRQERRVRTRPKKLRRVLRQSQQPALRAPGRYLLQFNVTDERKSPQLGVLRLWDFTKAVRGLGPGWAK